MKRKTPNNETALVVHSSLLHIATCQSAHGYPRVRQIPGIRQLFRLFPSCSLVHHYHHRCRSCDHLVTPPQCRSRARRRNWDFRRVLHGSSVHSLHRAPAIHPFDYREDVFFNLGRGVIDHYPHLYRVDPLSQTYQSLGVFCCMWECHV